MGSVGQDALGLEIIEREDLARVLSAYHPGTVTNRRTARLHPKPQFGISRRQPARALAPLTPDMRRQHCQEAIDVFWSQISLPRFALAEPHDETRAGRCTPNFGHLLIEEPGQQGSCGLGEQWVF